MKTWITWKTWKRLSSRREDAPRPAGTTRCPSRSRHPARAAAAILAILVPCSAQDLQITEVMGDNLAFLADEDGDHPDWIELYHAGPAPVQLEGWHLSDRSRTLDLWTFPSRLLQPGEFLLVFASGKDRRPAAGPLHASFRLDRRGEPLFLVRPDGTVASRYQARVQAEDASFGVLMEADTDHFLAAGSTARYLVPADGSLGRDWTRPDFDDSSWASGPTGLGYDQKGTPTYTDLIATDVGDLMRRVNPSIYLRLAFTVDDPAAYRFLLLRLKYEDGFAAYLNGALVAASRTPEPLDWNSRASGRRAEADAVTFQFFNLAAAAGLLVRGTNVLALQGLNDSPSSPDFLMLPELEAVRSVALGTERRYFPEPTPGWQNGSSGVPGVVLRPRFSVPGGAYRTSILLELSTEPPGAEIRYTLDGRPPVEGSPLYTEPIAIERSAVVLARAFHPDYLPSPMAMENYILLDPSLDSLESEIPILLADTLGRPVPPKESTALGAVNLVALEPDGDLPATLDRVTYVGFGGVKVRGSSSTGFPKPMYRLETWDERREDADVPLLGLPAESDWVLNGPYSDKTLMRNVLSYGWSNAIGRYAPRTRFFELYLNSTPGRIRPASYAGVYVLIEKIKVGPERVAIEKLYPSQEGAEEITGGYVLKFDRPDPGASGFVTIRGRTIHFDEPRDREVTPRQRAYIKNTIDAFEAALFGADFADPELGYERHIDVGSFIDHHLLTEAMKNIDGYRLSTFMYKDRGGKLFMGPLWDYNLSLGNADANHFRGSSPDGWYFVAAPGNTAAGWYQRLMQDTGYRQRLFARWIALRSGPFSVPEMFGEIDRNVETLGTAVDRNFTRWRVLGVRLWPNDFVGQTYEDEIGFMRRWLEGRLTWMDANLVIPPELSHPGGPVSRDFRLAITAAAGEIYYTLDGEDPRGEVDEPSPSAILYEEPFGFTENTTVRARSRAQAIWSSPVEGRFVVDRPALVVSEIMFDPLDVGEVPGSSFEFVELQNAGDEPIELGGVSFPRGVTFEFPAGTLAPGELTVVVNDLLAFSSLYDTAGIRIAGEYAGSLSNNGEVLSVALPDGERIIEFRYAGAWYPETQEGHSLVLRDPRSRPEEWGLPESWHPSSAPGGSPGRSDPGGAEGGLQRPGDLDQNGRLNISDAVRLLRLLFAPGAVALPCGEELESGNMALLDADGSGEVNLTDGILLLRFLFQRGAPPVLGTDCTPLPGCPEVCVP